MKKTIIILIALVILIGGYFMVSKKKELRLKTIKIGIALPLTGAVASFGEEFRRGAEVAIDEINSENKDVLKVIFEDTALLSNKAVTAVTKLVNADKVDVVAISSFSEAAATHAITDNKNLPMLVWWDSNPELEAMGDKVFALGPWTPASGEVTAEFSYDNNFKKAAVFGYNQDWSTAVSKAYIDKFKSLGGTITSVEYSNPGVTDYRTQLSKVIANNPDIVYMTVEDFFKGVKQIKDLGYKGKIITSDVLDNSQVRDYPELFEGTYTSQVADPSLPETRLVLDLYKNKFNEDSKKVLYVAWGYDSIKVLYKAYVESKDGKIIDSLYKVDYKGASGEINFDTNGSSKTIPKMFIAKNGIIESL